MTKQKILVPLDGSEFSRQIFATIRDLFDPDTTELILFESIVPPVLSAADGDFMKASDMMASAMLSGGVGYVERQAEVDERQYQRTIADLRQHKDALARTGKELQKDGYQIRTHAEMGDAADQIVEHARIADVDLIAMASHGRTGLGKLIMGSVAEKVLRESSVPVLLVRPLFEE